MSTKQTEKFETEIDIPNDVTVTLKSNTLQINGPVGRTYKNFMNLLKFYIKGLTLYTK